MIGFIIKNWKLCIDMLIVIGLVLGFTYWDPFDIFEHSKLKQTASLVTSVRDIGQLITAEYYGEVIASLKDSKVNRYSEDTVAMLSIKLFLELKNKLKDATRADIGANDNIRTTYHSIYNKFIAFLGTKYYPKKELSKFYNEKNGSARDEKKVLEKLDEEIKSEKKKADKSTSDFNTYLSSIPPYLTEFFDFYRALTIKDKQDGSVRNEKIVFIGRGWVKAGFDFGTLDKNNFFYEKDANTIHFYGLKAKVLDHDINPWFIPQEKVKGFDLVAYSTKVNFNDTKAVKAECKRQLVAQAGVELLTLAKTNGQEALRNFFSLLLNEPDLKVELHDSPYDHLIETVGADSLVDLREAALIDSTYRKEIFRISRIASADQRQQGYQLLINFVERLKIMSFFKRCYRFNYYSLKAAAILRDSLRIDTIDIKALKNLRGTLSAKKSDNNELTTQTVNHDSVWFTAGDFMHDYNSMIEMLNREASSSPGVFSVTTTLLNLAVHPARYDTFQICLVDSLMPANKTTKILYLNLLAKNLYRLADLEYDTGYQRINLDPMKISDSVKLKDLVRHSLVRKVFNKELRDQNEKEKAIILNVMIRRLETRPIQTFSRQLLDAAKKLTSN
jgi:hypothetical protein